MALLIRHGFDLYHKMNFVWDDERTRHMLFVSNPFYPIAIVGIYLTFVLNWGPKYMASRQPKKLEGILKAYNIFQVIFCASVAIKAIYHTYAQEYSFICQPVDYSTTNYHAVEMAKCAHYYFMSKVIDLFDTVFFVLKKKQSHVSFLHVYHHAGMVALTWFGIKYFPGGHGIFMGILNTFVHVIMYFYYYLTSTDKKYKQSIWKKYITQLQMIQFGLMALHWLLLMISPDCGYPKWLGFFMLPQFSFLFILFYNFYRKTYINPKVTENETKSDRNNNDGVNDKRKFEEQTEPSSTNSSRKEN